MSCEHENFLVGSEVGRIVDNSAVDVDTADVAQFVLEITIACADCGAEFGFRGPAGGHSWNEPRCRVDAKLIYLPLMPPAELELAGPLPVLNRGPMTIEVNP